MAVFRLLVLVGLCFMFGSSIARIYHQKNPFGRVVKRAEDDQDPFGRVVKRAEDDKGLCQKPMDLVFVLDSSESVGALNWDKVINFTRKVASKFDVQYTRVGVVQYHSNAEVPIALTSFRDNKTLDDAISDIYFKPGATRTDLAILKAIDVFNQAPLRKASRLVIFVIGARSTDLFVSKGKSINATDLLKQPSADLQAGSVAVYAASVSEGLPDSEKLAFKNELNIITSTPPLDHIFESPTYDDLMNAKADEVAKKTCIVNGGMSPWSAWSTCSVTCGTGTRVRMRTCTNPKPENGGLSCTESTVQSGVCSVQSCPGTPPPVATPLPPSPPSTANNVSAGNYSMVTTPISSNETIPPVVPTSIPSNSTLPPPSSNATQPRIPSGNGSNQTRPINIPATLPQYDLSTLNYKTESGPKPGAGGGSPWPPAPAKCNPNQASVYGYPDYKTCGNGFEEVTLSHHQITASSTYSKDSGDSLIKARHAPYNGLLNNTQNAGAWCAEHQYAVNQDNNQHLTIDLGQPQLIGKVATQGMERWDNWVSTFAVKFSDDNIEWSSYPRTLQGNCDRKSITDNILNPPIRARFIRFNPLTWYTAMEPARHDICMRVGLYKCRDCKLVPPTRCQIYSRTETRSKKSNINARVVQHLIKKVSQN